jgi:hypothetical protein
LSLCSFFVLWITGAHEQNILDSGDASKRRRGGLSDV